MYDKIHYKLKKKKTKNSIDRALEEYLKEGETSALGFCLGISISFFCFFLKISIQE